MSKKYGEESQVKILYASVSVIDIFNMILQTLLLPLFKLRFSWFKVIVLYCVQSAEYATVYLTCLIACHIYCGMSKPFKYHEYVSGGKMYFYLQFVVVVVISLIFSPSFNAYENLLVQNNSTTHISFCSSLSYSLEIAKRTRLSEYVEMFLVQIIPLLIGFFLALRATYIIWTMDTRGHIRYNDAMPKTMREKMRQENRNKGLRIIAVLVTITIAIFPRTLLIVMQHCDVVLKVAFSIYCLLYYTL